LTYTNVGAVADLRDISCLVGTSKFATIQNDAYTAWSKAPASLSSKSAVTSISGSSPLLGQHYYVINPITGSPAISPKWDMTAMKKNANAFVTAAKVATLAAPTGSGDIDWVQLKNLQGELATSVYRVDTKGGQPPASCTAGSPLLSVKYTAKYYLFGGTIKK